MPVKYSPKSRSDLFHTLLQHTSIEPFKMVFQYVVDQLDLSNIYEVILMISQDETNLGFDNQITLLNFILKNQKFCGLFNLSLEADKLAFSAKLLVNIIQDDECFEQAYLSKQDKKKLHELITVNKQV